jgi:exodeoxyribonuclease-5
MASEVPSIDFSPDQRTALETVREWMKTHEQTMTFGGFAGTGKTTLVKEIIRDQGNVAIVAFTGKAVSVLRHKGVRQAKTLHSLMYQVAGEDDEGDPIFMRRAALGRRGRGFDDYEPPPDLVIVDEASMINKRMHEDLEALATKILYVGDHGQLQPIGYDPGLMRDPVIRLEKIHRQAEGSPILRYAHHLREGNDPFDVAQPNKDSEVQIANRWPDDLHEFDTVLVGYNGTRHYLNKLIREARGFKGVMPQEGETLICLANNPHFGIFNGLQVIVKDCEPRDKETAWLRFTDFEGFDRQVPIYLPQLGTSEKFQREELIRENLGLFDWGYALTVHKAQGSEWDNVCVIEKIHPGWGEARWRYTAATRAAKKLTYVVEKRKLPWS